MKDAMIALFIGGRKGGREGAFYLDECGEIWAVDLRYRL